MDQEMGVIRPDIRHGRPRGNPTGDGLEPLGAFHIP